MDAAKVKSQPAVQATQAPKRTEESRHTQQREAKTKESEAPKHNEAKPPRPVVNAQGQTTGRLVNTSA